ncbi:hypothetical protein SLA2020_199230 [Shorea laevis]
MEEMAIARFKKGSKVEVLRQGHWLCGEVVSGDGHTYSVKYSWFRMKREGILHRVPRMALRPIPPPLQVSRNWVSGDLVEAFDNPYWKKAVVQKVLGVNRFSVKLDGCTANLILPKSHLRARRCWEDGKWLVLEKVLKRKPDLKAADDAVTAKKVKASSSASLHPNPLFANVEFKRDLDVHGSELHANRHALQVLVGKKN